MKMRLVGILILVCLVCGLMLACESKEEITAEQAVSIMLEDLGDDAGSITTPHVHTGTYENKNCYNIYTTINGESWVYVISTHGELLLKEPSSHSH